MTPNETNTEYPGDPAEILMSGKVSYALKLECRSEELARIRPWIEGLGRILRLPAPVTFDLAACAYEAVANIFSYGHDDPSGRFVDMAVSVHEPVLELTINDDGRPFNPLDWPEPPLVTNIEEAPISGRGISLVRKLSDALEYARVGQMNRLVVTRYLGTDRNPGGG